MEKQQSGAQSEVRLAREPIMTADEARRLGDQELFDQLERLVIETRGNLAEVARRIGRDRSTVRYHLRRFGMLGEALGAKAAKGARSALDAAPEMKTLRPSD